MPILTPTATQQIAEIADWLSKQTEEYQSNTIQFSRTLCMSRDSMLGEMRFLVNAAHAPGVTSDRLALYLKYLRSRQTAIIEINLLLNIE